MQELIKEMKTEVSHLELIMIHSDLFEVKRMISTLRKGSSHSAAAIRFLDTITGRINRASEGVSLLLNDIEDENPGVFGPRDEIISTEAIDLVKRLQPGLVNTNPGRSRSGLLN